MSFTPPRKRLALDAGLVAINEEVAERMRIAPGLSLSEAQLLVAQDYGFGHWTAFRDLVERSATPEYLAARRQFEAGKELARTGQPQAALAAFLWCFDESMKAIPAMAAVRLSYLLGAVERLGADYPPALEALRNRRDQARLKLASPDGDKNEWPDFVALNRHLHEEATTLEFFDQATKAGAHVPPAIFIQNLLLKAGRGPELSEIASPTTFQILFDAVRNGPLADAFRVRQLAKLSGRRFETLVASGDLPGALAVLDLMLKVDRSAETLAILREHAKSCGHPELIPPN